jgi:hypothetical protein
VSVVLVARDGVFVEDQVDQLSELAEGDEIGQVGKAVLR